MTPEQLSTLDLLRSFGYQPIVCGARTGDYVLTYMRALSHPGVIVLRVYRDGHYVDPIRTEHPPTALERALCQST